jgi:hypothetical protein
VLGQLEDFVAGMETTLADQDGDFGASIDDVCRDPQHGLRRQGPGGRIHNTAVLRDILVGARGLVLGPVLNVFRNGKVGDRAPGEGRLDRLIDRIGGVTWPHDALVVGSHIDEQLIEINILLMMRPNKIVEGMARNG